jgi:phosphoglycerol transferase MdoB-like AlkP superfamily enzyme
VKYTDDALRKFIQKVNQKDWFNHTIFISTADHCAWGAGKTELPVEKYHLPMLIFSPENIVPGVHNRLMSQIDIGPTLLGVLNFSDVAKCWDEVFVVIVYPRSYEKVTFILIFPNHYFHENTSC